VLLKISPQSTESLWKKIDRKTKSYRKRYCVKWNTSPWNCEECYNAVWTSTPWSLYLYTLKTHSPQVVNLTMHCANITSGGYNLKLAYNALACAHSVPALMYLVETARKHSVSTAVSVKTCHSLKVWNVVSSGHFEIQFMRLRHPIRSVMYSWNIAE